MIEDPCGIKSASTLAVVAVVDFLEAQM